jgi:hypothetical protein
MLFARYRCRQRAINTQVNRETESTATARSTATATARSFGQRKASG